jgi:hypothetical protein
MAFSLARGCLQLRNSNEFQSYCYLALIVAKLALIRFGLIVNFASKLLIFKVVEIQP